MYNAPSQLHGYAGNPLAVQGSSFLTRPEPLGDWYNSWSDFTGDVADAGKWLWNAGRNTQNAGRDAQNAADNAQNLLAPRVNVSTLLVVAAAVTALWIWQRRG